MCVLCQCVCEHVYECVGEYVCVSALVYECVCVSLWALTSV